MKIFAVVVKYISPVKKITGVETIIIDNSPPNKNIGFAAAVNVGIKKALAQGADKILLVNPDIKIINVDFRDGDIVAPVLKFKREGKWIYDYGGKVNWLIGRTTHLENSKYEIRNSKIDYVSGACMMIDKKVFAKIGYFDERFFMYFEDVDFCHRATKAGFYVEVDTTVIIEHGLEIHKKTGNPQKMNYLLKSNWEFIWKWIPWPNKILGLLYWLALFLKSTTQKAPEPLKIKTL